MLLGVIREFGTFGSSGSGTSGIEHALTVPMGLATALDMAVACMTLVVLDG